jgi:ATPase subunit of ABC transporter with duplicated ATPase domains
LIWKAINALNDALQKYPGTVLLVTHDLDLIDEVATRGHSRSFDVGCSGNSAVRNNQYTSGPARQVRN